MEREENPRAGIYAHAKTILRVNFRRRKFKVTDALSRSRSVVFDSLQRGQNQEPQSKGLGTRKLIVFSRVKVGRNFLKNVSLGSTLSSANTYNVLSGLTLAMLKKDL